MKKLTDEIIWSRCLEGDTRAFEELYKRYYALLYNYGCKLSGDKELVADCIQNLFIKLIRNYARLSAPVPVKSYLLKAFRYKLYDTIRDEGVRTRLFVPCIEEILLFEQEPWYVMEENKKEEYALVYKAFRNLSARQKEILYLYYIAGLTHEEIAGILNLRYQSSKNLLARSLVKLRENYFRVAGIEERRISGGNRQAELSEVPPVFLLFLLAVCPF